MQVLTLLHSLGDAVIFVSYMGLALWCWSLFSKLSARRLQLLGTFFGLFIFLCGITHLNAFWSEVHNSCEITSYWSAITKQITALVSLSTMFVAWYFSLRGKIMLRKVSDTLHDPHNSKERSDLLSTTTDLARNVARIGT